MTNRKAPRRRALSWFPALVLPSVAVVLMTQSVAAAHPRLEPETATVVDAPGDTEVWIERPALGLPRFAHEVAMTDGRIFVVGGVGPDGITGSVEARRVNGHGRWNTIAPMPTARANAAAAAVDGAVYVAGGIIPAGDGFAGTDVVERYDTGTATWGRVPTLPETRVFAGAAGLDGLFYVAGGFLGESDTATSSVVVYNPRTRSWRPIASMMTTRARLRLVAADGQLYAIGGVVGNETTATPTVERYDPRIGTWVAVAPMNQGRVVPGATSVRRGHRQLLVVIGGEQSDVALRTTEVFDLSTGRWDVLPVQLPVPTVSLVAAEESDGTVLAIGGFAPNGATNKVSALKMPARDG